MLSSVESFTIGALLTFSGAILSEQNESKTIFSESVQALDIKNASINEKGNFQTYTATSLRANSKNQSKTNGRGIQDKHEQHLQGAMQDNQETNLKNQVHIEVACNGSKSLDKAFPLPWRTLVTRELTNIGSYAAQSKIPNGVSRRFLKMMGSVKKPNSIKNYHSKVKKFSDNGLNSLRSERPLSLVNGASWASKVPSPPTRQPLLPELAPEDSESPFHTSKLPALDTSSPGHEEAKRFQAANNIKHIHIIPGVGEFVYDTKEHHRIVGGVQITTNVNNPYDKSDALVSLDQLKDDLPNIEWVSVVVTWFSDSLDIGTLRIRPAVEYLDGFTEAPDDWRVAAFSRSQAHLISRDHNGNPRYGGTVSDAALIRFIEELHLRGYKVMLYPIVLPDTQGKEWRGRLTGHWASVKRFFIDQYGPFIVHYTYIAKRTEVEAFVIGSGLVGVTKIKDPDGQHPAVTELVKVARYVKLQLGSEVIVTYAADWTEYHSLDGWYYMDELWASQDIGVVGINAYFPLTNRPEPKNGFTVQDVIHGWSSGEGYDYHLDYSKNPPEKTAYSDDKWGWKYIEKWWSEVHVNPNGDQTEWRPKMKKIWFTEYGFPSVDACTNEPDVFVDGTSEESKYPRFSRRKESPQCQRTAIEGTLKKWQGSKMVESMFLWAWDARPFPFFPIMKTVWGDCHDWRTGHWIEGKIGRISESRRGSVRVGVGSWSPFKVWLKMRLWFIKKHCIISRHQFARRKGQHTEGHNTK